MQTLEPATDHVAGNGGQIGVPEPVVAVVKEAPQDVALDARSLLGSVITELENSGSRTPSSLLENGAATMQGAELVMTVAQTAKQIDVIFSTEARQVASRAASAAAGRPLEIKVVSGNVPNGGASAAVRPVRDSGSARGRAANEPVVQRMQELFGAEVRTVIDQRHKD